MRTKEDDMAEITKEQVIEFLSNMTVLELTDLIKTLEDKWGVTAAAPVAVAAAPGAAAAEPEEEKTEFDVVLKEVPSDKRIPVIKTVKSLLGLGLKEAKEMIDGLPKTLKEAIPKEEAEEIKKKLTEAGAVVEVK